MAIIYLHGFASVGKNSPKAKKIQEMFPNEQVYAPDLSHEPIKAVETIKNVVNQSFRDGHDKVLIIGTSLGGFYGWWTSAKYDIPAVLINPVYDPNAIMTKFLGKNKNFKTGEEFDWHEKYIDELDEMWQFAREHADRSLLKVILAKDDDVIPYEKSIKAFTHDHTDIHVFDDGGHRFDDLDRVKNVIEPELKRKSFESLYEGLFE